MSQIDTFYFHAARYIALLPAECLDFVAAVIFLIRDNTKLLQWRAHGIESAEATISNSPDRIGDILQGAHTASGLA